MATSRAGVSGAQDKEAAPRLAEQLEAIELALKGLHACGRAVVMAPRSTLDLRPAARAAERAVAGALEAYDGRRDVVAALCDAVAATEELENELGRSATVDPGLEVAVEWAKSSAGWLRKAIGSPCSGRMPVPALLTASIGAVSLHMPARSAIAPTFNVADPLPPPPAPPEPIDPSLPPAERMQLMRARAGERQRQAEERRAARAAAAEVRRRRPAPPDAQPGFVPGVHRALSLEEAIVRRARLCFEDVAALGMMRVPQLGEDWRAMATIDERMFAAIDAIVSLGPLAVRALEGFVVDAPAKDPTRGFAVALVHGSIDGRDGLAAAERALAHLGTEAETAAAFGEGLYLAPNHDIPVLLRQFLAGDDPALRALGIGCLARKGLATLDELAAALLDDAPGVVAAALVPASLARLPDLARRCDELMGQSHEDVLHELAWALVLGEVPFAVSRLREWLGTPREEMALMPVVLAGERDDVDALVAMTEKKVTRPRVAALGFGGSPAAIPLFVRLLREAKDDELKLSVAFALQRLTDAPLFDDSTIPPEKIDVPEPDEPDDPSPSPMSLARRVSDPRDLPAEGSPDRVTLPSTDAARWEAWLAEREGPYPEQQRLRRGKPFTPNLTLTELADYLIVPSERRLLHRELVLKTGEAHPFDTSAYVPVQRAQLDVWAAPAQRASAEPGAWGRARRRS